MARWTDEGAPDPDMDFLSIGPADQPLTSGEKLALAALGLWGLFCTCAALWVLLAYVAPAIPKLAAWIIQTGGRALWGL